MMIKSFDQKVINKLLDKATILIIPKVQERLEKSLKGWKKTMRKFYSIVYSRNKAYTSRNLSYYGLGQQIFPFARSGKLLSSIDYSVGRVRSYKKGKNKRVLRVEYSLSIGATNPKNNVAYSEVLNKSAYSKWKGVGYIDKSYMYAERKIAKDLAQLKG